MFTLFIRTIIVYLLVFAVVRLMGKRQISDMQPFDLVITLLIADLAAVPISDGAIPLMYGVIPILGLFILHRIVAHFSLKSEAVRAMVCGKPVFVIIKGRVMEDAMRSANYTLNDLTEQLRMKDVFSIAQVEYGILETNGSLSVLLKGPYQPPNCEQLQLESENARPSVMLITDGKIHDRALAEVGFSHDWLIKKLNQMGYTSEKECLFVCLNSDGMLHAQDKLSSKFTLFDKSAVGMDRSNKVNIHYLKVEGYNEA